MPQVAEARLLACADEQAMLWTLQEEQARCFDSDRLFSLAFDAHGVAGRLSRAQLVALRTKHRQLLLAQEPGPPQSPSRVVATHSASATGEGEGSAPADAGPADSSDEEQGPVPEDSEKFEMLSHDDVGKEQRGQTGRGSFFGASLALPKVSLPGVSLSFARNMFE